MDDDEDTRAGDVEAVGTMRRWEWDRSKDTVLRVVGRARAVTWGSAAVLGTVLVVAGWVLTTDDLHWSAVIYGLLGGVAGGYLVRAVYVASRVRRAVKPLRQLLVPDVVEKASVAQLVSLVVNGGSMFEPYVLLRAVTGDAVVEITQEDLADREWPRPGFFQLLTTGPDGIYYDDGSGTMDQSADSPGSGFDGSGFDGGGFDGGGS